MAYFQRHSVLIATSSDGTCTAYTSDPVTGYVQLIAYNQSTASGPSLVNGHDLDVTAEVSGINILGLVNPSTASYNVAPRMATCSSSGGPIYDGPTSSGSGVDADRFPVANERLQFVIAGGGSSHFGQFYAYVGG